MYIGQIFEIPIGGGGLVGTRNQSEITPDQLIIARNISYEGGVVRKEGGAVKYNSVAITGAPSILAGWDFWPTTSTQRMIVVTSAGNILKDSGAATFPTTLKSGLTVSDVVPMFVEGGKEAAANNRKLFIFTGKNAVQVLAADGATTSDIATPPADWTGTNQPTFGLNHEGRLWGGGNSNDPHRIYYSTTTNHEDLTGTGSGSLSIYPGEGEKIVGALSFKGLIVVWKFPVGVYVIDTTDPSVANWKVKRLTASVGGVSPLGATITDDDVVFVDAGANYQLLSTITEFGDVASRNLSRVTNIASFVQDNFNAARLPFIRAIYYSAKREVHFATAQIGGSVNNSRFVLDLNKSDKFRFRFSDRDTCESLWLRKDTNGVQRLVSGDNAGFVWDMDKAVRSKDSLGYNGEFQTPYMDFSWIDPKLATVRKNGEFLEVVVEPTGNWNMSVDIFWDGELVQTVTYNLGLSGAALGSFVIGTDALAGDQTVNRKKRIVGGGRRISLKVRNSGAGEDFSVARFYLHCSIGDERHGRDVA